MRSSKPCVVCQDKHMYMSHCDFVVLPSMGTISITTPWLNERKAGH